MARASPLVIACRCLVSARRTLLLGARMPGVMSSLPLVGESSRVVVSGMPGVVSSFRLVGEGCRIAVAGMPVTGASSFAGLDVV